MNALGSGLHVEVYWTSGFCRPDGTHAFVGYVVCLGTLPYNTRFHGVQAKSVVHDEAMSLA